MIPPRDKMNDKIRHACSEIYLMLKHCRDSGAFDDQDYQLVIAQLSKIEAALDEYRTEILAIESQQGGRVLSSNLRDYHIKRLEIPEYEGSTSSPQEYLNLYTIWQGIKYRCCNPRSSSYKNYGGRGIQVYSKWKTDYHAFRTWILNVLGKRPTPKHSLDRVDNNGDYKPGNLRWATPKEQCANRRTRVFLIDVLRICRDYVSIAQLDEIKNRLDPPE